MTLPARRIGPFTVSAIGYGCMNLSHGYGMPLGRAEGERMLAAALDGGVTLLDTAALYGGGENEKLFPSIARRRGDYLLSSKGVLALVDGRRVLDGRPKTLKAMCDASLMRLGTDVIDLYYLHRLDPKVPVEESVGALSDLVRDGKIRAIGLSEMSAPIIERAHAVYPVSAVQSEYSLVVRNPEVAVLDTCARLGIAFVPFSPLGRGMLAGAVRDHAYAPGDLRLDLPRFVPPNLAPNLKKIAGFEAIARELGCAPAQLALAWLLAKNPHVVPIPGTTRIDHLEVNLGAVDLDIDCETIQILDAILPANALTGARYAAAAQAQIDTEFLPGETVA